MSTPGEPTQAQERILLWEPRHEGPGTRVGVLVKRTYRIRRGEKATPAETHYPLFAEDVHYGRPFETSIRHEADGVPFKPRTDVVVNARAYAPRGRPVREMLVGVSVGGTRHQILVIGDRYARQEKGFAPFFSEARKFETLLLRYEYAYGGTDPNGPNGRPVPYPRNPVGMGAAYENPGMTVDGMPLPNIEHPDDRLTPERFVVNPAKWEEAPRPAGLGWVSRSWWQRSQRTGAPESMRALWDKLYNRKRDGSSVERKPFPAFDPAFYNGASDGLAVPHLRGDETITLERLDPDGDFDVLLPGIRPVATVHRGAEHSPLKVPMTLLTIAIEKEEGLMYLVWGGEPPDLPRDPEGHAPEGLEHFRLELGEERVR